MIPDSASKPKMFADAVDMKIQGINRFNVFTVNVVFIFSQTFEYQHITKINRGSSIFLLWSIPVNVSEMFF